MTYIFWTISHCSTVVVSATPPTVFGAGILNMLHSSDMHKGNRILIQVITAELCPLKVVIITNLEQKQKSA